MNRTKNRSHRSGTLHARRRLSIPTRNAITKTDEENRKGKLRLRRQRRVLKSTENWCYSPTSARFRKGIRRFVVLIGIVVGVNTCCNICMGKLKAPAFGLSSLDSILPGDGSDSRSAHGALDGNLEKMKDEFELLNSTRNLLPCRLDEDDSCFRESRSFFHSVKTFLRSTFKSTRRGHRLLLHNSLTEDRYWCGKRILGGGGTLEVVDFPAEWSDDEIGGSLLPYVYSKGPPRIPKQSGGSSSDSNKILPIELRWNYYGFEIDDSPDGENSDRQNVVVPCSVPCNMNDNFEIVNTIQIRNTPWTITHSMEGELIHEDVHVRPAAYRENQFYATTSFQSEIPLPYFSWSEYNIQHEAVDFDSSIKGASFLAQNCNSLNHREEVVETLIKHPRLRVDSLSECLHNAEPLRGVDMSNKTAVIERYLFHLSFENQNSDDYITEKLWGALASGTLPVYLGAKNVKEHVPERSIIVVDDFESPTDLGDYLSRLTLDKELYESYHKWRYQPLDSAFTTKYGFTKTHSNCRMCKWAFAKRHGLGWNHTKQSITSPYIEHKTCRNKIGLIGYPFKEYWLFASKVGDTANTSTQETSDLIVTPNSSTKTCTLTRENRVIDIDHGAIHRKVFDRDGVTDFIIDITNGESTSKTRRGAGYYILRLEIPIQIDSAPRVVNDSVWWFQDHQTRYSVMVSWSDGGIQLSTSTTGMPEIKMPSSGSSSNNVASTVRVRIVTEDMDHFHQKTQKTASYFGDLMTRDFFEPVQSFRIEN